jgi:hypothetical protein
LGCIAVKQALILVYCRGCSHVVVVIAITIAKRTIYGPAVKIKRQVCFYHTLEMFAHKNSQVRE